MKTKIFLLFLLALVSVSTFADGGATEQNLSRRQFLSESFARPDGQVAVAFFDADSTLRVSLSGNVSANGPKDVKLLPFVADKIAELTRAGYLIAIVSNQGGVESGVVAMETADQALRYTADLINEENPEASVHYIDFAEKSDEFRKPKPGMGKLLEAKLRERGLTLDWKRSFMVGDSGYKNNVDMEPSGAPGIHFSNSDRLFAENLDIPFFDPTDFFGWRAYGVRVFDKAEQVERFMSGLSCADLFAN